MLKRITAADLKTEDQIRIERLEEFADAIAWALITPSFPPSGPRRQRLLDAHAAWRMNKDLE